VNDKMFYLGFKSALNIGPQVSCGAVRTSNSVTQNIQSVHIRGNGANS